MLPVASLFWAGKPSESNHLSAEEEGADEGVCYCPGGRWGDI